MQTFYVELINRTDSDDNETRKVRAKTKEEAKEKVRGATQSNFYIGRCVAARSEDAELVREFRSYCGGTVE